MRLIDLLHDIGWKISDDGLLQTEDALIGEQFFPPNSTYDAYVTIREILASAFTDIVVVDGYVGSSLILTLKGLPVQNLDVCILTIGKHLKPDFAIELAAFRSQVSHIRIEVRTTAEFHDRFIVIDGQAFYHVGASM